MSADLAPWIVLAVVVGAMLALDLLVLHRTPKPVPFREAAVWSAIWISLALAFGVYVSMARGGEAGGEYLAGYLIELSLSVDNVFVFALIFAAFAVPAAFQHRLLFWGILGAIVFRAVFIAAGTALLAAAHWAIYVLGVLLVITGIRLAASRGHEVQPERNPVLRAFRRLVPATDTYRGAAFIVRDGGRWLATPLLAVLITIETTDIMFALDSIPAVFAVTTDPFLVYSSNLFAILGLRSLYFLLAGLLDRFAYLRFGLAALLAFAGAKILVGPVCEIPVVVSLAIIGAILAITIAASLGATHPDRRRLAGSLVRIAAGVGLGLAGLAFFGLVATTRDGAWRLVPEVAAVLVGAVGVVVGLVALRHAKAKPWLGRVWAMAGLALLVGLILLSAME